LTGEVLPLPTRFTFNTFYLFADGALSRLLRWQSLHFC